MQKVMKFFVPMFVAILILLPFTQADEVSAASTFEDGEYDLPFQVKSNSGGESTAGKYLKSGKLIVKDGKNTVQMTVSESSMLKELTIDGASETTVQEDDSKNTRVAQFVVGNVDKPLDGKMHVVVPEMPGFEGYDEEYVVQFIFNTSKIPGGSEEQTEDESDEINESNDNNENNENNENDEDGTASPEDNPKTGDHTPILILTVVLLASGFVLVRKVAFNKMKN